MWSASPPVLCEGDNILLPINSDQWRQPAITNTCLSAPGTTCIGDKCSLSAASPSTWTNCVLNSLFDMVHSLNKSLIKIMIFCNKLQGLQFLSLDVCIELWPPTCYTVYLSTHYCKRPTDPHPSLTFCLSVYIVDLMDAIVHLIKWSDLHLFFPQSY